MKPEDMKTLYRLIDERQALYRDKIVATQFQQSTETPQEFENRKKRVFDAHVTSVTITMKNGELLTGNTREIFDVVTFWESVKIHIFQYPVGPKGYP